MGLFASPTRVAFTSTRLIVVLILVILVLLVPRKYLPSVDDALSSDALAGFHARPPPPPEDHWRHPPGGAVEGQDHGQGQNQGQAQDQVQDQGQDQHQDQDQDQHQEEMHKAPVTTSTTEQTRPTPAPVVEQPGARPLPSDCPVIPGAEQVVVVVKTGATEAFNRIPELYLTLLRCVPNYFIFSDLEQDIGAHHIHDALTGVSDKHQSTHNDFVFYRRIQAAHAAHEDLAALGASSGPSGWELDKWKNIPILHDVYQRQPHANWYAFIDADTFVGWENLLHLLSLHDPAQPLYFGASYVYGPVTFGQGGTGYVVSNEAARLFEATRDEAHVAKWEDETARACCGDVMLAVALNDSGVRLTPSWPMTQSLPPSELDWSERLWCTPAVTWHHVKSHEVEALWEFEQYWARLQKTLRNDPPHHYMYRDAFAHLIEPHLVPRKKSWNNLSQSQVSSLLNATHVQGDWDWNNADAAQREAFAASWSPERQASVHSPDLCAAACVADQGCKQWFYRPGQCHLGWDVVLGRAVVDTVASPDPGCESGWMIERITAFKERMASRACEPNWALS